QTFRQPRGSSATPAAGHDVPVSMSRCYSLQKLFLEDLPRPELKRKIDSTRRCSHHNRSTGLRISKNQQFRGTHCHSGLWCFSTMVELGKQPDSLCLQNRLEPRDGFVHGVMTRLME